MPPSFLPYWIKRSLLIALLLLGSNRQTQAQHLTDTLHLEPFTLHSTTINEEVITGSKFQSPDSLTQRFFQTNAIDTWLQANTPAYIKSYGATNSSTISLRGTAANHTQVFWEGIPINSTMSGLTDFSLIPTAVADTWQVQYGAASLATASGGLGGNVLLKNNKVCNEKWCHYLQTSVNTLGNYQVHYGVNVQGGIVRHATCDVQGSKVHAKTPLLGRVREGLKNVRSASLKTGFQKYPLLQQLALNRQYPFLHQFYLINEFDLQSKVMGDFVINYWYNQAYRPLLPSFFQSDQGEEQHDKSWRSSIKWKKAGDKGGQWSAQAAYTWEYLRYINPHIYIDDTSRMHNVYVKTGWQNNYFQNRLSLIATTKWQNSWANVRAYQQWRQQAIGGMSLRADVQLLEGFKMSMLLRQEVINKEMSPFLPYLGLRWKFHDQLPLELQASLARNYRVPSLNDQFWLPDLQEKLLPEKGWQYEVSLNYWLFPALEKLGHHLQVNVTSYYMPIHDWISWQPDNTGIWRPQNILEVHASGVELATNWMWNISATWSFRLNQQYTFTRTINQASRLLGDQSVGKQLIYVPIHQWKVDGLLQFNRYYLHYFHNYTGKRYSTADNYEAGVLVPYQLGDLLLGKKWEWGKLRGDIQVKVYNLWNVDYELVATRPMLGRYGELRIHLKF